jgi:RimJ/RimL family protein N-acetyltransferase
MTDGVSLRDVREDDLPAFFGHQLDPEAVRMAGFPARGRDEFMAHWTKIMAGRTAVLRTILLRGEVAGNIVAWEQSGALNVGYWLGRAYWGKGIASAALSRFLTEVSARPIHACVAKHNAASIRVLQKCGFVITGEDRFARTEGEPGEEFIMTLGAG